MISACGYADRQDRSARFNELRRGLGMSVSAISRAIGRPLGTVTAYSHAGATARIPPQEVIDAMEDLLVEISVRLVESARRVVEARGYEVRESNSAA